MIYETVGINGLMKVSAHLRTACPGQGVPLSEWGDSSTPTYMIGTACNVLTGSPPSPNMQRVQNNACERTTQASHSYAEQAAA